MYRFLCWAQITGTFFCNPPQPHRDTHLHATYSSDVSLIDLAICCGQRLGVLIWIWRITFTNLLIEHKQLCTVLGNICRHCTLPPPRLPLCPLTTLFLCSWCSISNCCHLFHMSITRCHWLSSIPSLHFCFCGASTPSLLKRLWIMFKIILPVFPMR